MSKSASGLEATSKPMSHCCAEPGCMRAYLRRGDLTRHVKEVHQLGTTFRCPIQHCHANSRGFTRMYRLVEHLMTDLSHSSHHNQSHPELFSKADAVWVAHDFNATTRDFREIVFGATGAGMRTVAETSMTAYRCRVPEKYVSLYFRVQCPMEDCSFLGIPIPQCRYQWATLTELNNHMQESHRLSWEEAHRAELEASLLAYKELKAHPVCGLKA